MQIAHSLLVTLSQKVTNISQGSVATYLRCGGIVKYRSVTNLLLSPTAKKCENWFAFAKVTGTAEQSTILWTCSSERPTFYVTLYVPGTESSTLDVPQPAVHSVDAQAEPVSERWRSSKPSPHHPPYSCYNSPVTTSDHIKDSSASIRHALTAYLVPSPTINY